MARLHNPYGDGHASTRIAERIHRHLSSKAPLFKTTTGS
jgi:UDP-N-acetylglucosamine 2-epimerase